MSARFDKLEVLDFLRINGCPWDNNTCLAAVRSNNPSILKYAIKNGCPIDVEQSYNLSEGVLYSDNTRTILRDYVTDKKYHQLRDKIDHFKV